MKKVTNDKKFVLKIVRVISSIVTEVCEPFFFFFLRTETQQKHNKNTKTGCCENFCFICSYFCAALKGFAYDCESFCFICSCFCAALKGFIYDCFVLFALL